MTRVELGGATDEDYQLLHAAMEAEGFNRIVSSDQGETYWLPRGEYYRVGRVTREQVLTAAQRAGAKTGKPGAIMVAETSQVLWSGLTRLATPIPKS